MHNNNQDKSNQKKIYVNEDIKAFKILLLSEDGEKIGIFDRKEALNKAKEVGLDLVQVGYNPKDKISTCKIMDYGKYQYYLKKKEKEKKNAQKNKGFKEIKISYGIEKKDLDMKVEKAKKLLLKGYNIKVSLKLRGRENIFKDQARENIEYFAESLKEYARSGGIKEENKGFSLILFAKLK